MRKAIIVRQRVARDLTDCARALAQVHERDGYPVNWPENPGAWLAQSSALLTAWVAELDGRIVGHVGLARSGVDDAAPGLWSGRADVGVERTAVVSRLFVAPGARGQGVGALLLERAVKEAHERGLHPVLDVLASATTAATLYERLGWELLDTVEREWLPGQIVALRCYAAP
ncbi:GNAT family N-acetyltransferase [Streptomyces sp. NPDC096132]|uniref:GNAT family N-acetyltransferase n=1 Tax=Streptomyces sp. NPDC096132 TaxID=3366075 RepID=UPI0038198E86